MAEDLYQILGVPRNASQTDIEKAYRKLARKYHPDKNPDDPTATKRFQELQRAFDVLKDPEKREMYDRYGSSFESRGAGGGPRRGRGGQGRASGGGQNYGPEDVDLFRFFTERFGGDASGGGFDDLFGQFGRTQAGGGRTGRAARRKGADVTAEAEIPLPISVMGGEVQLSVRRASGHGETIAVKIPAGIEDGKKIRLRGQGEASPTPGGTPGDLLITIHIAAHPHFHREGSQLFVKVPVTVSEAALGAKIDVPTPKGTVAIRVPAGTSSGTKLRIKGQGVPAKDGPPGDLLAEIQIVLPKSFDEESQRLLRQLQDRNPQNPRDRLRW